MNAEEWVLPAPLEHCVRCQASLAAGTRVTVVLVLDAGGPRREDLCADCGQGVDGKSGQLFWRGPRVGPDRPRQVFDFAMLSEVFERMRLRAERPYQRLAYLLGLVLVRKRWLKLKGFGLRDGQEVMLVSRGAQEPEFAVPAPHLSADDLLETREQLQRLLSLELPGAGELLAPAGDLAEAPAGAPDRRDGAPGQASPAPSDAPPG